MYFETLSGDCKLRNHCDLVDTDGGNVYTRSQGFKDCTAAVAPNSISSDPEFNV